MAATGYTPIQLYRTSTSGASPTSGNLIVGELAINYNTADMSVWALNTGGSVVRLMNNPAGLKYPTVDGTANQVIKTDGSGLLSWVTAILPGGALGTPSSGTLTNCTGYTYANLSGTVPTWNQNTTGTAANLTSATTLPSGTTLVAPILGTPSSGTLSSCTVDGTNAVGFKNIPKSGPDKVTAYTLASTDIGKYIGVGSSGSIVVPNSTYSDSVAIANGDAISIFNNTSGNITLTMTITTAYIGGIDADKATITLATRGIATILFVSATVCVVSGNVS